jgi:hypothetical protein
MNNTIKINANKNKDSFVSLKNLIERYGDGCKTDMQNMQGELRLLLVELGDSTSLIIVETCDKSIFKVGKTTLTCSGRCVGDVPMYEVNSTQVIGLLDMITSTIRSVNAKTILDQLTWMD